MKKLTSFAASIFAPPFRGLPVLIWVYFALSFVIHPHSPILRGHFVDSDDYLYLAQAIDWIKGQSWFDVTQYRMNPPGGTPIHFSALMNLVYGVPIAVFSKFIGIQRAATVTAALFPLIYLALLLYVARRTAELFMDRDWAGVTAYITLFAMSLMLQFIPGRVDHHGLEALFGLTAFGFAARMMLEPENLKYAFAAGLTLAFALAIALEITPVLLVMAAVAGLWATLTGGTAARAGFAFAATLFVASFVILLVTKSFDHLFETDDSFAFSIIYVAIAGGIAACFGAVLLTRRMPVPVRIAAGAITACIAGIFLAWRFLTREGGPAGAVDPEFTQLIFRHASEAWPVIQKGPLRGPYVRSLILPIMALASQYMFFNSQDKKLRWPKILLAALCASSYFLALFFQQRMMVFADAFSIIPLAILLQNVWRMTDRTKDAPRNVLWLRVLAVLLVGPLTTVMFPAFSGRYSPVDVALFPVQFTETVCDQNGLIRALNTTYGDRPHILMNMMDQSTELLLRTPHMIIASAFPQDVGGNRDGYRFFMTKDPAEAESIVRKHKADLVIACKKYEDIYNNDDDDSDYGEIKKVDHARMMQRLVDGKIPNWLKPVAAPLSGDMLLFEVVPAVRTPATRG